MNCIEKSIRWTAIIAVLSSACLAGSASAQTCRHACFPDEQLDASGCCQPAPVPQQSAQVIQVPTASQPALPVGCPQGMSVADGVPGHCCYPGQLWLGNTCRGIPSVCPAGTTRSGETCAQGAVAGNAGASELAPQPPDFSGFMLDFGAGVGTTFNPKLNLFGLSGDTSSAYSPGQFVNLRMGYRFNRFVSAAVYYQWGYLKPNSSWDIDPSGIYLHDVGMDLRGYLTPNTRAGFQASFGLRMGWGRFAVNDATLFYGSSSVNADYHVNSVVITPVSVDLGYRFALGGDRYGTIGLLTEISFWRPHSAEYCEDSTCVSTEEGDLEVPGAEKSFSLGMHASWVF